MNSLDLKFGKKFFLTIIILSIISVIIMSLAGNKTNENSSNKLPPPIYKEIPEYKYYKFLL